MSWNGDGYCEKENGMVYTRKTNSPYHVIRTYKDTDTESKSPFFSRTEPGTQQWLIIHNGFFVRSELEMVMRNPTNRNKVRVRTANSDWNDYDSNYTGEDSEKTTAIARQAGVFTSHTFT